jgi:hypothetical protein
MNGDEDTRIPMSDDVIEDCNNDPNILTIINNVKVRILRNEKIEVKPLHGGELQLKNGNRIVKTLSFYSAKLNKNRRLVYIRNHSISILEEGQATTFSQDLVFLCIVDVCKEKVKEAKKNMSKFKLSDIKPFYQLSHD